MTGKISGVKKIAVLRANALGDLIFILPALVALRETYPQAEIILLGKPWHREFFKYRPRLVDRCIVIPVSRGVREEIGKFENRAELDVFFQQMRQEQFDIAIQLHGGGRYSNPFVLNLGAKLTIGLKTPDAALLDRFIPYIYYQNEILRYLEVVSLIGASTQHIEPSIQVTTQDLTEAQQALGDNISNFVVLHPGASDLRRHWSYINFAQVGDYFSSRGYRVIITGSRGESKIVASVINQMNSPAEDFCNTLSINGLTGLLSKACLVVSNDTGPLHLAESLGTKTIGIFWCGNLINAGPITRKNHRALLSWIVICPLCGENCARVDACGQQRQVECEHKTSFVDSVSVEDVLGQIQGLLGNQEYRAVNNNWQADYPAKTLSEI